MDRPTTAAWLPATLLVLSFVGMPAADPAAAGDQAARLAARLTAVTCPLTIAPKSRPPARPGAPCGAEAPATRQATARLAERLRGLLDRFEAPALALAADLVGAATVERWLRQIGWPPAPPRRFGLWLRRLPDPVVRRRLRRVLLTDASEPCGSL